MEMLPVPHNAIPRPQHARQVCSMCGEPSEVTICEECSERLRFAWKPSQGRNTRSRVTPGPTGIKVLEARSEHSEIAEN